MNRCDVCARNPERMNSEIAECSHADCPHRRKAWSERPDPVQVRGEQEFREMFLNREDPFDKIPEDLKRHER